jgi:hypothetical protein
MALFAFSLGTNNDHASILRASWVPEVFPPPFNSPKIMILLDVLATLGSRSPKESPCLVQLIFSLKRMRLEEIPLRCYAPPSKMHDFADPTRGVPPFEGPRYHAGLGILSQTNEEHFAAFGTGVTGQGLRP